MRDILVVLIAAASMLPLVSQVRSLWRSIQIARDGAGIFLSFILVLGGLLYEARVIPTGQSVQVAVFVLLGATVMLACAKNWKSANERVFVVRGSSLLPALISGLLFLINALMNTELPLAQSLGRLLAVSILMLTVLGITLSSFKVADLCRVIVISVLVICVIAPFRPSIWRACDIFKCGPFGAIYTGPFGSENALAIFACVGILCVFGSWSGRSSVFALFPLSITLYATESRTSQLALACAFGAWAISSLWIKVRGDARIEGKVQYLRGQVLVFSLMVVGIFLMSIYLLLHAEPSSFSNRGNIWIRGLTALGDEWWSGLGLDRWTYLQSAGILPMLFPHSQYLLLLFGGGILAVLLLGFLLIAGIRAAAWSLSTMGFGAAYAVFLSVLGLTEAYWNPIAFDGHTFLVLPLILLIVRARPDKELQLAGHCATVPRRSVARSRAEIVPAGLQAEHIPLRRRG